ncbi:MAG: ester cyclase [Flavipsychrobacter sp.]|jgi:predicted ester cyclase|nr:ester cyclase [Flavipsychrobacter sp.]
MTPEQNKTLVRRINKEYIEGRNESVAYEILADDFINRTAPPESPRGPQAIIWFFNNVMRPAFPDIKVVIHDQVAEGDLVTTRKTFHATHKGEFFGAPATDKQVKIDVIDIVRIENGKFKEHWGIVDVPGLMAQINGN